MVVCYLELFADNNYFKFAAVQEVVGRENIIAVNTFVGKVFERKLFNADHRHVFEIRTALENASFDSLNACGKNDFRYYSVIPERRIFDVSDGFYAVFSVVILAENLHFGVTARIACDVINVFCRIEEIIYAVSLIVSAIFADSVFIIVFGSCGSYDILFIVIFPFSATLKVALIINSARQNVILRARRTVYVAFGFLCVDENVYAGSYAVAYADKLLSFVGIGINIEVFAYNNGFQRKAIEEVVICNDFALTDI